MFGRRLKFIVIDARSDRPGEAWMRRFLYSREAGLVAHGTCRAAGECREFSWLADEHGSCPERFGQSLPKERFLTDDEFKRTFGDR